MYFVVACNVNDNEKVVLYTYEEKTSMEIQAKFNRDKFFYGFNKEGIQIAVNTNTVSYFEIHLIDEVNISLNIGKTLQKEMDRFGEWEKISAKRILNDKA
ncbi:hypothetical protein OKW24_005713 [Peribacillus simplex]|uniref:hypothetical protein n=1 Tax=Peribacillus simplex TaxID=1478 RepID=UPI0024E25DA5|nr:hypothetical protein [Peribacillus simplex]MDF9763817.1 hypothetical protein [Peribacillus simplex]